MGRCMRVAADYGHAGQRGALFRADHMHDALANIGHIEFGNAVLFTVVFQGFHLQS